MKVGFKMQIYPTVEQEFILKEYCKVYHDMWNYLVAKYKNEFPKISSYGIVDYRPIDLIEDFGCKIPQRIVLGVIKTYSQSVKRFYGGISNKPKFHKFNPNKQSFYMSSKKCKIKDGFILIPSCKKNNKDILYKIKLDTEYLKNNNITEIIEPRYTCYKGKWFLSGSYNKIDVQKTNKSILGLDWGIKNFMTSSNGEFINYPKSVLRGFQRIKHLQSIKDKKSKGSNNYYKIMNKISRAYDRLENLKKDFIEQKTTELCRNNNIAIEDINYQEISHKKNSKFIRRQNTISPYYRFIEKLQWKCDKFGSYFIKVEPNYTSQICCNCGQIHNLYLRDRIMKCDCGNEIDRDVNAAINIKNRAELTLSSNAYLL